MVLWSINWMLTGVVFLILWLAIGNNTAVICACPAAGIGGASQPCNCTSPVADLCFKSGLAFSVVGLITYSIARYEKDK